MLTPKEAYELASQWGSLIHSGDPGAVFYSFKRDDARPDDEAHRNQCLAYLARLIGGTTSIDTAADISDLHELVELCRFFANTELRPS